MIMKLAYGYPVKTDDDYFVKLVESWFASNNKSVNPGAWLVESYPFRTCLKSATIGLILISL